MRPLHRSKVHKGSSSRKFRAGVHKTKAPNVALAPMRGGWRL